MQEVNLSSLLLSLIHTQLDQAKKSNNADFYLR